MAKIDSDSDDFKSAVADAVEEATRGLKAKRDELLADNRKLKDASKALEGRLDELEAGAGEAARIKAEKEGDVAKIREQLEAKHRKELDKITGDLTAAKGTINKLVIDNGLTEALTAKGVSGVYLEGARALIQTKNKIEIAEVDGQPTAQIGGKALGAFVEDWVKGEHGKHFTVAPANAGGGANGTNGGSKGAPVKSMTRTEFESLPPDQRVARSKEGVALTD